jgi:hypothetical protein
MGIFETLDDSREVVHAELTLIESHDHTPENGIRLRPVHALKPAQLTFYPAGEIGIGREVNAFDLDMRPAMACPSMSLAPADRDRDQACNPGQRILGGRDHPIASPPREHPASQDVRRPAITADGAKHGE